MCLIIAYIIEVKTSSIFFIYEESDTHKEACNEKTN